MENKSDTKHHLHKHGKQGHRRPRDAYELYELDHVHMPLYTVPDKDRHVNHEADYYETGMTTLSRNDTPPEHGQRQSRSSKEKVDAEAEAFIMSEHQRFQQSRSMATFF